MDKKMKERLLEIVQKPEWDEFELAEWANDFLAASGEDYGYNDEKKNGEDRDVKAARHQVCS